MIYRANHYFFFSSFFRLFYAINLFNWLVAKRSRFIFLSSNNSNSGSRTTAISFPIRINKSSLTWCGNFNCYNNTTNSQLTIFPFVFLSILRFFFAVGFFVFGGHCLMVIFVGIDSGSFLLSISYFSFFLLMIACPIVCFFPVLHILCMSVQLRGF